MAPQAVLQVKGIFELPFVVVETFLLLFSSITYGMAAIAMYKNNKSQVISWLALTWLFVNSIGMEMMISSPDR